MSRSTYLGEELVDVGTDPKFDGWTQVDWAMLFIDKFGQFEGGHHRTWTLDMVARILKGTKVIVKLAKWSCGTSDYRYSVTDPPSAEYIAWREYMKGDENYGYDEGSAP
jgi:hypothetical protein